VLRVIVVLVVVGLLVYALVDCLRADSPDLRLLPRPAWLLLILVPLVGPLLYLLLGRPLRVADEPVVRPLAPDDDPEFLRRLDIERRRRQADEERRRRRERQEGNGGPEGAQTPE
jgi:Phospholipase_D-nuclease N-terminal